ncbi:HU family DNA-binding protein [Nocardioides sp.]|uniref:HU family DNA-binding protein n=1 Tax=Nocardioides sp. TaxID=35761 RepID=UPI0039E38E25
MNKRDLVAAVAAGTDLDTAAATAAVDAALSAVADALGKGEKVSLPGFGTFETRTRAARSGRNPQTGEPMEIGPSTTVAFKPASALKAALTATS